ncbi:hypothetical protein EJ05DRAFT_66503 [Pseudovirgaria hyperparasitica]|uniref:Uncharacterized protein n=1 Tax=Pseudovirgaria hyperparasitica TaxID=470096 RepID=A0A6A6W3K5_9PEZI|nr:uncharacterized protein EJ05DRAFT_66503 [Pseudovirgaria hyperparasitica]KAF2756510.1 hypothetical protein EJ05DRAFT_66503 [Pseudovirgaria hyperparasitica]
MLHVWAVLIVCQSFILVFLNAVAKSIMFGPQKAAYEPSKVFLTYLLVKMGHRRFFSYTQVPAELRALTCHPDVSGHRQVHNVHRAIASLTPSRSLNGSQAIMPESDKYIFPDLELTVDDKEVNAWWYSPTGGMRIFRTAYTTTELRGIQAGNFSLSILRGGDIQAVWVGPAGRRFEVSIKPPAPAPAPAPAPVPVPVPASKKQGPPLTPSVVTCTTNAKPKTSNPSQTRKDHGIVHPTSVSSPDLTSCRPICPKCGSSIASSAFDMHLRSCFAMQPASATGITPASNERKALVPKLATCSTPDSQSTLIDERQLTPTPTIQKLNMKGLSLEKTRKSQEPVSYKSHGDFPHGSGLYVRKISRNGNPMAGFLSIDPANTAKMTFACKPEGGLMLEEWTLTRLSEFEHIPGTPGSRTILLKDVDGGKKKKFSFWTREVQGFLEAVPGECVHNAEWWLWFDDTVKAALKLLKEM